MRRGLFFLAILGIAVSLLSGCTPDSTLQLEMPIWPLVTFSDYTVHALAYRLGYSVRTLDLVYDHFTGLATGTFSKLPSGTWFVQVTVLDADRQICSSGVYIDALPNATVRCELLPDPWSGQIVFTLEQNEIEGYVRVDPADPVFDRVLFDSTRGRLYIFDSDQPRIGVFSIDSPGKTNDLTLPQAPSAAALSNDGTAILLGFSSGLVYSLDPETGTMDLMGDAGMPVYTMAPFSQAALLTNAENCLKIMDLSTGAILDTKNMYVSYCPEPIENLEFSSRIYLFDNYSVAGVKIVGNTIISIVHYGAEYPTFPVRLIMGGRRLITAYGQMFRCSPEDDQDAFPLGELGYPFADLASDDAKGYLYVLGSTDATLKIVNQSNLFTRKSVPLPDTPKRVFQTADLIVIIVKQGDDYFMRTFKKSDLGL